MIFLFAALFTIAVQAAKPFSHAMPAGALAYAEVNGLGKRLIELRDSDLLKAAMVSPQFKELQGLEQWTQFMALRGVIEGYLAMDAWTAADKLFNEIAVGVYSGAGGEPSAVVMFRVSDTVAWAKVRKQVDPLITLVDEAVKREPAGDREILNFSDQLFVILDKDWALLASTRTLLAKGLAGLQGKLSKSMAGDEVLQQMRADMGGDHLAEVCLNVPAAAKAYPAAAKAYGLPLELPEKMDNFANSLLFHGILEVAAGSPYLGLTLGADKTGFKLTSGVSGDVAKVREKHAWFLSDPTKPGTRDFPAVPGLMGGLTMHRNLAEWYKRREELLTEDQQAGFDGFETNLGNILPGQNVEDDFMPAFGSTFTLIAARQTFDHLQGEPGIKLPGFALMFDLEKPENGRLFQLVFQTIVTITNIVGVEEGLDRQPSVMTAVVYKGVPINTIEYLKPPQGKQLNIGYNFVPCAATINGRFVFCTSLQLCKSLVDALAKPKDSKRENRNLNFELHLSELKDLVTVNQKALLALRIQQGKTAAGAKGEIQLVEQLLDFVKLMRLSTSVKEKGFQLQLEGQWK